MPNLTDVLNGEDEPTVEDIAKGVCLPITGGTLPTNAWIDFTISNTEWSGYKWTTTNGVWASTAINNVGYTFTFDGNTMLELHEDGGKVTSSSTGLFWDNEQVLVSNPTGVTGANAVTNIMSLTQAEYDAIVSTDASTLYVING